MMWVRLDATKTTKKLYKLARLLENLDSPSGVSISSTIPLNFSRQAGTLDHNCVTQCPLSNQAKSNLNKISPNELDVHKTGLRKQQL